MKKRTKITRYSSYEFKIHDETTLFEKDIIKENPPQLKYLTRLFKYVFSSAKAICTIFLSLAIFLSILQPFIAFIWGLYVDKANNLMHLEQLKRLEIISLIGLALFYWLINFISDLLNRFIYGGEDIERLSKVQDHRLQEKFQAKLFKKIAGLYPDYMEVPRINDMIDRSFQAMGSEWSSLQKGVIIQGYVIIAKIVSVIAIALSLYFFNPLLCFIILIAPIPTLYTTYIGNKLKFKFFRDNNKIIREANYYQNILLNNSAKEVKVLNLFDFFFNKWKTLADSYVIKERKNQRNIFLLGLMSGVIANLASVAASIFAIILLTKGHLSIGALGAVLVLINTLMQSTSSFFNSLASFISHKNEAAQFFELIDLNEQICHYLRREEIVPIEKIEIKNVYYRYPLTDIYRLKNINFTIKKGEKIALVGKNGAGKTTFIKLLIGMLEPSDGKIFINNQKTHKALTFSRYNSLSYVFQEPIKFNTFTIADNVFLGDVKQQRNNYEISQALRNAGLEDVNQDDLLGKDIGGTDLSGGEWQKLAIARSYYRNRDFIVLDEMTSNLDPLAEAEIYKKYLEMATDKTVIFVTHRISIAALVQRVVVFKDGEIIEDGHHSELLAKKGEYARLYSVQAKWYNR